VLAAVEQLVPPLAQPPAVATHLLPLLPVFGTGCALSGVPLVMLPYALGWKRWSSP
jgi:hypothetical protein